MKRATLAIVVLVMLVCEPVLAGEFLMNDTGKIATALRVTFSEPVTITGFGDILKDVTPSEEATEFTFSGGFVEPWGSHWLNWEPASAVLLEVEWLSSGWDLSADATAEDFDYQIALEGIDAQIAISRHIDRNCLPFSVMYSVVNPQALDGYTIAWDTDKYVDTDGDGDPQDDRDHEGYSFDLLYLENYNPTITLLVLDDQGELVAKWENMARNDFRVGEPIALDTRALLESRGIAPDAVAESAWMQKHMDRLSLEYMTEYDAVITTASPTVSEVTATAPGRHVLYLDISDLPSDSGLEVAGWFVSEGMRHMQIELGMTDIWNEVYDPGTGTMTDVAMFFSNTEAAAKLAYLAEIGLRSTDVTNPLPLVRESPMPVLTTAGPPPFHHIGERDLVNVLGMIPEASLMTGPFSFDTSPPYQGYWFDWTRRTREYFESYFEQYEELALEQAQAAADAGAQALVLSRQPYLWELCYVGEESGCPGCADWIGQQWLELISNIRSVFDGELGIVVPHSRCDLTRAVLAGADFIEATTEYYRDRITWPTSATVDTLRSSYQELFDEVFERLAEQYKKPLLVSFPPFSYAGARRTGWDGSFESAAYRAFETIPYTGADPAAILRGDHNPSYPTDFAEQVRIIEAFMPVAAKSDYLKGVRSYYEYWQLLDFSDFAPDSPVDYLQLIQPTLQGKPGMAAYRLWASMLSPNDELLYRRCAVPLSIHAPVAMESGSLRELAPDDWQETALLGTLPRDFTPEAMSPVQSQYWSQPGHEVESIRMFLGCDVLAVQWRGYEPSFLDTDFQYALFFYSPGFNRTTFFVYAKPRDGTVQLEMRVGESWYSLPSDEVDFVFRDRELELFIPDLELPTGDSIADLGSWTIEAYLRLMIPGRGGEFFNLIDGVTYNEISDLRQECP